MPNNVQCHDITLNVPNSYTYCTREWKHLTVAPSIRILALHGWLDNAATFDLLAPLIVEAIPSAIIVGIDFVGHGKSAHAHTESEYNLSNRVLEVLEVADALRWNTFILMGHSMGANVATMVAGTAPQRIQKLVLLDGFLPASRTESQAEQLEKVYAERKKLRQRQARTYKDFGSVLERYMANSPIKKESAQILLSRGTKEVDVETPSGESEKGIIYAHDPRLLGSSMYHFGEAALKSFTERIRCPVLLFVCQSSLDRWAMFREAMQKYTGFVKNITIVKIEGNHHVHLDEPQLLAPTIIKFLSSSNAKL